MIDLTANVGILTAAERKQYRETCQKSLYFLCKAVLGFKDFTRDIHKPACDFLQDQTAKRKRNLMPRFFFKSSMGSVGYPIWLVIQEPNDKSGGSFYGPEERIFIGSAKDQFSMNWLRQIEGIFERNLTFQALFPELIPDFTDQKLRWNQHQADIPRRGNYAESTFTASGGASSLASQHYTRLFWDDRINEQHAESPELMEAVIRAADKDEPLLVRPNNDEILYTGTRWGFHDLYSHQDKTGGAWDKIANPKGWHTHLRAAIEDGRAVFPERAPMPLLDKMRRQNPYLFSCIMLNNPQQPDVNEFQEDWLQKYTLNGHNHIVLEDGLVLDPTPMQRVTIIDIATSQRKRADFTAVVTVACDDLRNIYILEAWRGKTRSRDFIARAVRQAMKWHVDAIRYEDRGQQRLVEDPLRDAVALTGRFIPVTPIKTPGSGGASSVDVQIRLFSRLVENRQVFVRESMTDLLEEMRQYPIGAHDDLLAALSYVQQCFTFAYTDIPERPEPRGEAPQGTIAKQRIIHARPDMEVAIANAMRRDDERFDEDIMSLMNRQGRSTITGY